MRRRMGLVDLGEIASLLICPRCRSGLIPSGGSFRCRSPSCIFGTDDAFPVVGPCPVFVDFEESILQPSEARLLKDGAAAPPVADRWSLDRLPAWLRPVWRPSNRVAARNVELMLSLLPARSPLVLVIGGANLGNGVEAIYLDPRARIIGFDLQGSPLTQFIADAHRIPLADESVDAVLIQAVLEHVVDPGQVVREIERVLRPNGLVYAETAFLQQVHAGPFDFVRYTSSGHRYLFREFEEIAAGPVAGPGTQLLWSVDHIVRALLRSELAGKLARAWFFWLRFGDRITPPTFAMDNASAYFFLGRRAGRALRPHELVSYYRGAQRPGVRTSSASDET